MATDSALNSFAMMSVFSDIHQSMPQWFQQGGIVMWLLLLASFLTTVVTIERLFIWSYYALKREQIAITKCFNALHQKQTNNALFFVQEIDSPAANMLERGIGALPFPVNDKMQSYAEKQISLMSRGQSLLDTIITLSPMLGILGTVLGIIESFNILSLQGVDNPTAVVGGIAQALISTAMGLCVALMALLPYNLFRSFINKLILHLEIIGSEFNHICQQKSLLRNPFGELQNSIEQTVANTKQSKPFDEFPFANNKVDTSKEKRDNREDMRAASRVAVKELYAEDDSSEKDFFASEKKQ